MPAGVSAWTPLANITLGTAAPSVTFSSIAGTYRDLRVVISGSVGSANAFYRFNNDDSSTYLWDTMEGNGSSVSSAWNGNAFGSFANNYIVWYSSNNTLVTMDILDYSATDKHKTVITRANRYDNALNAVICRWPSTAAITSIKLDGNGNNWAIGSTFALYGVSA